MVVQKVNGKNNLNTDGVQKEQHCGTIVCTGNGK
jgi:hypothetical protein